LVISCQVLEMRVTGCLGRNNVLGIFILIVR
jgi:hypothetical protein